MEKEEIYNVLTKRGYDERTARLLSDELVKLQKPLDKLWEAWAQEQSNEGDWEVQGFSISKLKTEYQMDYPAALLTMEWLIEEPEKAIKSLRKGIK